jgi:selenocysteine-specific elongation factor
LGGGEIIDHQPKGRHKRFNQSVLKSLESFAQGSPAEILLEAALGLNISSIKDIVRQSRLADADAESAIQELLETGQLILLENGEPYITSDLLIIALPNWKTFQTKAMHWVQSYHKDFPLRRGIPREELKSRLKLSPRAFNALVKKLITDNELVDLLNSVAKVGHEIRFNGQEQAKVQALMRKFEANPFSPPSVKECQAEVGEEAFNALIELNEFITVSSEVVFRRQDYDLMVSEIHKTLEENGRITLAEVRDLFKTSRKYAQALLEHLDAAGKTVRDGDFRKLKK